ncbi:MAG: hypothetical protein FWD05_06875 [Oscillospiraceae bacterium]|nr:hypothetical protein [Oscillospiraceae bacterium]
MYDIHCHIIPGVDDGAGDYHEAKKMLQFAYNEGIHGLIATPHYNSSFKDGDFELWEQSFKKLKKIARSVNKKFMVHQGAEIFYDSEVLKKLQTGAEITMAGSNYVLLEFPYDISFKYLEMYLINVMDSGFNPIIAHMERYVALHDLDCVESIKRQEVLLQVNTSTIVSGSFSKRRRMLKLIEDGYIDAIGSDAHNVTSRPANWAACIDYLNKKVGYGVVERLTTEVYEKIIKEKRAK